MQLNTFLMFDGRAEEALSLYADLFEVEIEGLQYFPPTDRDDRKVYAASLMIAGQRLMFFDSPVTHEFGFTPAVSLFIDCDSAEELDRLAEVLGKDGKVLMPLQAYDFARRFTWINDRFGVSWQLRLP